MNGDGVEHPLEWLGAAHLAAVGAGLGHAVEHVEQMPVRALVLVDRHRTGKASSGLGGDSLARALPRRLLLVCALALVSAPSAWGHAIVIGTDPPNGSVLAGSPTVVAVSFDDAVRVGSRNAAISNDGDDVIGGRPTIRQSRTLVIPLKPNLPNGNYTVRWSIVSDDGHQEEGVIAFGIGKGGGTPVAALGTRGVLAWQEIAMRAVFFLGVLAAVGAAFFGLVVLGPLAAGRELMRRHAVLLSASFLFAFVGADALIRATSGSATRFERVLVVAAVASLVGTAAAAVALYWARAIYLAWAAALVLLACPTRAGHALDGDQPALLAPLADVLHLGAAAVWLGGLASLVLVVGRAPEATRMAAARRFSNFAIPMVLVLATAGASRALTQLTSVSQLWETGYGRTLLVKSALFAVLIVLGWLNRRGLAAGFARLRRIALAELLVLLVVVVAVGALTDQRPGSARATTPKPTQPRVHRPPPAPPPGAFVDGAQAGPLAVGFAYEGGNAIVTLTGRDGDGVTRTPVTIDGRAPRVVRPRLLLAACARPERRGPGRCHRPEFRSAHAAPSGDRRGEAAATRLRGALERRHPRAALVRPRQLPGDAVPRAGAGRHGLPNRGGEQPQARRHGGDRDRLSPLGSVPWRGLGRLAADAAAVPVGLLDGGRAQRVLRRERRDRVLRPVVSGLVPRALRPADGARARAAHGRHRPLHGPRLLGLRPAGVDLAAALAVALRLALDQLEEARRVLERGEPGGRVARAARGPAQAAGGHDPRRADEPAEREGAEAGALSRGEAPLLVVHATILRCGSRLSATCSWT